MEVLKVPFKYVDASELGTCPASVDMQTGVISINRSAWDRYDNFERSFVLMHEIGHYELDTDDEFEADEYALRHVYKTAPRSLIRSLQTLCKINVIDSRRLDNLYQAALELDAEDGNELAAVELERINEFSNPLKTTKMTKRTATETYPTKKTNNNTVIRAIRRADGRGHGMNGVHIGDWYFSLTNLLLAAILLTLLFKK